MAAVVVVVVVAVSVLGVGLFVVWRRRNTSKVELQPARANGSVGDLDNPVYGGKWVLYKSKISLSS